MWILHHNYTYVHWYFHKAVSRQATNNCVVRSATFASRSLYVCSVKYNIFPCGSLCRPRLAWSYRIITLESRVSNLPQKNSVFCCRYMVEADSPSIRFTIVEISRRRNNPGFLISGRLYGSFLSPLIACDLMTASHLLQRHFLFTVGTAPPC
jgi:hypothetical protein